METAKIDAILGRWHRDPNFLIEILQDVQDEWRYLPADLMRHVADSIRVPLARVHHAATFYKAFSLEQRGRYEVQVCMGTACHVKGAVRVLDALARELDIEPGATTEDGEFTLDAVRCIGCCGLAPAVVVDEEVHSEVRADRAHRMLRPFRKGRATEED
jgi:NADH:ubiquinone oxidoreductase subunit E